MFPSAVRQVIDAGIADGTHLMCWQTSARRFIDAVRAVLHSDMYQTHMDALARLKSVRTQVKYHNRCQHQAGHALDA